ncbi:MAG: hypothetical protein KGI80_06220 [Verrucomicrobiota bacterium]|nr:hypothetical protein [Verrucomicrobiota bacterium]
MNYITLPCSPKSDLNWTQLLPNEEEKALFWHFDLQIDFPLEEELPFQELSLALSLFREKVWPLYQEKTIGASFYRGSEIIPFHWTAHQENNWEEWKKEAPPLAEDHLRRLFVADAFAYYWQKLAHALPDELPIHLLFEKADNISSAERHHLLSKERYEYFRVGAEDLVGWSSDRWNRTCILPPERLSQALLFPEQKNLTPSLLQSIDRLLHQKPLRIIPEPFLNEEWDGVDELYLFTEGLSPQGERKLKGFTAAGGTIRPIA